jgi:rubrerythrin
VKVHDVMVAVLGAMSLSSCRCATSEFALDQPLTAAQLDEMVESWGVESVDDLTCEDICDMAYGDTVGWHVDTVDTCTLTLPESTGVDGSIQCAGVGLESPCEGRRPLGHLQAPGAGDGLGDTLASMAHLEAASIEAFEELAAQLRALHAPQALVERCLQAADDERAHARWLGALASRSGASVPPCRSEPRAATLLDIALHNAVEGCVNETWAALRAHLRARTSPDPRLRALFARVAQDETRHGQLAWDLHAWFLAQLDESGRARVREAQARALAALPAIAAAQASAPPELGQPAGVVTGALAADFARRLAA